jgi:hypothetical protein
VAGSLRRGSNIRARNWSAGSPGDCPAIMVGYEFVGEREVFHVFENLVQGVK